MSEFSTHSRAGAQAFLKRLFVAFVLPWAFISAQAASAHISPVPAETTASAAAGKSFVVDVRNGVAAVKVERFSAQPGKSSPPVAIVSSSSSAAQGAPAESIGFSLGDRRAQIRSAPSNYWSRGPPGAAANIENIKSI